MAGRGHHHGITPLRHLGKPEARLRAGFLDREDAIGTQLAAALLAWGEAVLDLKHFVRTAWTQANAEAGEQAIPDGGIFRDWGEPIEQGFGESWHGLSSLGSMGEAAKSSRSVFQRHQ
jgi:hypothetical protein